MKWTAISLCLATLPGTALASPLFDVLFGGAMIATGGVFELQRSKANSDKEDATKKGVEHLTNAVIADENAFYYQGAADWERINFGQTSIYFSLLDTSRSYALTSTREVNAASRYVSDAEDAQDKENLYKGVSLVSFSIGGVFIVKGAIGYAMKHNSFRFASKLRENVIVKNLHITPTRSMDGVQLLWTYRI